MASNALDLESQAIPPRINELPSKRTRSVKPLALKMEVFAARTSGVSKRKIAKDLGIAENTVTAILKEGKFDSLVAAGKFGLSTAIFDSVETITRKCKTSERSAMYVLDKMVFVEEASGRTFQQNLQVNVHIPRPDSKQFEQPIIEAKAVEIPAESTAKQPSTKL